MLFRILQNKRNASVERYDDTRCNQIQLEMELCNTNRLIRVQEKSKWISQRFNHHFDSNNTEKVWFCLLLFRCISQQDELFDLNPAPREAPLALPVDRCLVDHNLSQTAQKTHWTSSSWFTDPCSASLWNSTAKTTIMICLNESRKSSFK